MSPPRIVPGTRRELGLLGAGIAQLSGLVAGTNAPNLFRTLGHQRKLFRSWLRFAARLMPGGTLPRKETELVILRVAHLRESKYEFDQHVQLARRVGLNAEDIVRITAGPSAPGWTPRQHAVLRAVDMLHERQDIDDPTWEVLQLHLDDAQCVELCVLVGHYEMLATAITALRIQPDLPRPRWSLGRKTTETRGKS